MKDVVFTPAEELDELVESYVDHDSDVQMMLRNGMSVEMYTQYTILNQFLNDNDIDIAYLDNGIILDYSDSILWSSARACAEHYGLESSELVSSFQRCNGFEFYDTVRWETFRNNRQLLLDNENKD